MRSSPFAVSQKMNVDDDFRVALVRAGREFEKAWGEEEAKEAALAERQSLELELQAAKAARDAISPGEQPALPPPRPAAAFVENRRPGPVVAEGAAAGFLWCW